MWHEKKMNHLPLYVYLLVHHEVPMHGHPGSTCYDSQTGQHQAVKPQEGGAAGEINLEEGFTLELNDLAFLVTVTS